MPLQFILLVQLADIGPPSNLEWSATYTSTSNSFIPRNRTLPAPERRYVHTIHLLRTKNRRWWLDF
jgi:hypothetical protein